MACRDPATWPVPDADHHEDDLQYGHVWVRAWADPHAIPQNHSAKGSRGPKPLIRGTLILVEVSRLPGPTRLAQVLRLWWRGSGGPAPTVIWRAHVRRFDLEHTYRFAKQVPHWTIPRPRHPVQADRWTWLVLLAHPRMCGWRSPSRTAVACPRNGARRPAG